MKFECAIVFYNTLCSESTALQTLSNFDSTKIRLHVLDNSTQIDCVEKNTIYCCNTNLHYINMKGNRGLAKAYNETARLLDKGSWLILFDQDTTIPATYLLQLEKSILSHSDIRIHVPIVIAQNRCISPAIAKGHRIVAKKEFVPGIYKDISAINSGMAIHYSVFKEIGYYCEQIFLDYLDHYFLREYRMRGYNIAVFACVLQQSFSDQDHTSLESTMKRFEIYLHDFHIYCMDSSSGKLYYFVKILCRRIKLCFVYHNIVFLMIKNSFGDKAEGEKYGK